MAVVREQLQPPITRGPIARRTAVARPIYAVWRRNADEVDNRVDDGRRRTIFIIIDTFDTHNDSVLLKTVFFIFHPIVSRGHRRP